MKLLLVLIFFTFLQDLKSQEKKYSSLHSAASTKYFLGSNGLGLVKREAVYQNTLLLYNELGYGATNWCSINMTTGPVSINNQVTWLVMPSVDFHLTVVKNRLSLGHKTSFSFYPDVQYAHTGYITVGKRNLNATFGISSGIFNYDYDLSLKTQNQIYFHLKFMGRISKKTLLLFENNFLMENDINYYGLAIFGGRTVFKRIALSYALMVYHKVDVFVSLYGSPVSVDSAAIPYLSFSYYF